MEQRPNDPPLVACLINSNRRKIYQRLRESEDPTDFRRPAVAPLLHRSRDPIRAAARETCAC
jgi:hypothetical protein